MKIPYLFIYLICVCFSRSSEALEYGCEIRPSAIEETGTQILKSFYKQGKVFPNSVILGTAVNARYRSDPKVTMDATIEGFYRPLQDEGYAYFVIPILSFALSRVHTVVYVCAHADPNPQFSHITVYFLNAYGLQPLSFSSTWQELVHPTKMERSSIEVKLLGVGLDDLVLFPFLDSIPILGRITSIPSTILGELNLALGDFLTRPWGAKIERIVITPEYLELDSEIDEEQPQDASVFFKFNFSKADRRIQVQSR